MSYTTTVTGDIGANSSFSTLGETILPHTQETIITSHAGFNYRGVRTTRESKIAYLNTLSSISGATRGHVLDTLGDVELLVYKESLSLIGISEIPKGLGSKMLEELTRNILPTDILYLQIVIAEKARKILENYYMRIGEDLQSRGVILRAAYYGGHSHNDGIYYEIRD